MAGELDAERLDVHAGLQLASLAIAKVSASDAADASMLHSRASFVGILEMFMQVSRCCFVRRVEVKVKE